MSGSRWRGRAADAGLVLGVGLVALVGLVVQSRGIDTAAESAALLAVLASSGALYVRRRHPVPVGVVALVAVGAYGALLHKTGPIMLVFVVALYTVVDEGHLRAAIGLGLASVIAFAVADSGNRSPDTRNGATLLHAGWLVAVIVGVTRNRRAYLAEAQARAVAAEQRLEEESRRRATEERLRIARELHDVLGHHLSLINVQASAALHRPDPARSEQALTAIKETSKETLRELRATLGVLRQESEAPIVPAPGLNRLDDLITTAGRSELEIRTEFAEIPALPPEVDLAVYRIVQEALTNVARHAGATNAVVRVRPDRDDVLVEVEDDGTGAPGTPGSGILGMRERARALGGSLTTGTRPDGGFRVRARLPLRPDPTPVGERA
ncbi:MULTISPECIES: sensor histidine kinase [unclassified Micromonospora]|uniref:sensor histidine kinase n=1 Tax=unclassified Micromonospora TaxID=2617518 RepID=UPI001B3732D7|nr:MULTISPECIES: sensor histidine kinase [unclassified Micromonospora]MBQ0980449.1 sensor histidine kinase [Micromonospora sp. M61]MBQ1038254.1 sensor histidine kinase [Micromonospora sp. C81]